MKKSQMVGYIICEALFGVAAIVFFIVGFCADDSEMSVGMYIIGGVCLLCAVIVLIGHLAMNSRMKTRNKNCSNPTTLAYQLTQPDSDYDCYEAFPDTIKQSKEKTATNVAGVLSFVFLGVGFFSTGKTSCMVYVSADELVVNDSNNYVMDDNRFRRFPAASVENIRFETLNRYERVVVSLYNYQDDLILDIPDRYRPEDVRVSFLKLIKDRLVPDSSKSAIPEATEEADAEEPFSKEF